MKTATVIAANRFGLGARPGELARIDPDPRAWLTDQLQGPGRTAAALSGLPASSAVLVEVQDLRRERRDAKRAGDDVLRSYAQIVRRHFLEQTLARYRAAVETDVPFHERLVHFWSNHFAISADKQPIAAIAGLFENEAIRPNVTGKFRDLLLAAEQHPAMILYLDNERSVGPNSRLGKRANRRRNDQEFGLNENLAREILELHTLGANGGYAQQDVAAFARMISGWSIGGVGKNGRFAQGEPGRFEFRGTIHEPGDHRVLGVNYGQKGVQQGEAVLRDLAVHPSTARHIASKLVRHFVADVPPADLVSRLTGVYLDSGGDLAPVYAALIDAAEPWERVLSKYKTPHDLVVSAYRAFRHVPAGGRLVFAALEVMGQTPFRPGSPAGWPDTAEEWGGANALYKRVEWSDTVAAIAGRRRNPLRLGDDVLGPALSARTREAIARAESVAQGMTLLLASPEFQRR